MAVELMRQEGYTILDLIDRILDKGLAINADISISLAGTELLSVKIKATIASFETAAKYGMEFPAGADQNAAAWKDAKTAKENCPGCRRRQSRKRLLKEGCPWCGWVRLGSGSLTARTNNKGGMP